MLKKLFFIHLILLLIVVGCNAIPSNENRIPITVKSIYNGDKMTVYCEQDGVQQEARVRFLLIDSSEMNHKE